MPDDKRQPDPRPLSTEYHKAHKQLMLWSAILFIWELVGIDLEKAKEAGGSAGAIVVAIKSPQAIPWALTILVAYFLFKTTVEWFQCGEARRKLRVAQIDFTTAWVVPITAFALYAYQVSKNVQVADVIQSREKSFLFGFGFVVGVFVGLIGSVRAQVFYKELKAGHGQWKRSLGRSVLQLFLLVIGVLFALSGGFFPPDNPPPVYWRPLISGFFTGIVFGLVISAFRILVLEKGFLGSD
jgi:hypothetical protein